MLLIIAALVALTVLINIWIFIDPEYIKKRFRKQRRGTK